jgi:hypothetical protein
MSNKNLINILLDGLEDIAKFGNENPGKGFTCSKKAKETIEKFYKEVDS